MVTKGFHIYKTVIVFFITGIIGAVINAIFGRIFVGTWSGQSSLIWGWFSVMWGLEGIIFTVCLSPLKEQRDFFVLAAGVFVCIIFEYVYHIVQEHILGIRLDYYGTMPYILNGKVNIISCLTGGVFCMFWIKNLYPLLLTGLEYFSDIIVFIVTWIIIIGLGINIALTYSALERMKERRTDITQKAGFEIFLDKHFPDLVLTQKFPGLRFVDTAVPIEQELLP